jgi:hypothetical protein
MQISYANGTGTFHLNHDHVSSVADPGWLIPDPDPTIAPSWIRIPDPRVKKHQIPDPTVHKNRDEK